jgi:hypothetical protein
MPESFLARFMVWGIIIPHGIYEWLEILNIATELRRDQRPDYFAYVGKSV